MFNWEGELWCEVVRSALAANGRAGLLTGSRLRFVNATQRPGIKLMQEEEEEEEKVEEVWERFNSLGNN